MQSAVLAKTRYFTPWPSLETVKMENRALQLACIDKLKLAHVLFGLGPLKHGCKKIDRLE